MVNEQNTRIQMYCAFKKSRVFQFLTFIVQIIGTQHSSRIALVLLYYNV